MLGISKKALTTLAMMTVVAAGATVLASAAEAYTYHHYHHHAGYRTHGNVTYAAPRRAIPRDRVANPGRGNPDKTPVNATTLPF
jgi:hypothetical protein